jgi:ABC-2 type transport system permease protein
VRASWDRIRRVVVKEFIQTFRDPRMRVTLIATPLLQLFVYGYALNLDVTNIAMAVVDLDRTQESRELVRRFEGSGYFEVTRRVAEARDLRDLLDRGRVKVAVEFDPGFATDIHRGRTGIFQLIVDGTDSNTASVVGAYVAGILAGYNAELAAELRAPATMRARPGRVALEERTWYNPNRTSRNFFVPGVVAMLLFISSLQLTAMAIVREREIGTIEQLLVTPLRPAELILGKTIPFALIGFVDAALITAAAVFWFRVSFAGSVALLFGATGLFLLPALGCGLFISTIARTQQQALMSMFFVAQPAMLLSGLIFPVDNMPRIIQIISLANPLRHFLEIVRGIFLKGNGADILWPQLLALLLIGLGILTISASRLRHGFE